MALLLTSSYEVLSIDNCKLDRLDADQNSVDLELVIPFGNDKPNLAIKGIIAIGAMSAMSLAAASGKVENTFFYFFLLFFTKKL